jgi:hypothetical protein
VADEKEQPNVLKLVTKETCPQDDYAPGPKNKQRPKAGWKRVFLATLREYGMTVTKAAKDAGVSR